MRDMPGKCKFNLAWLHHNDFCEWVSVDQQSKEKAFGKLCKKTVDIGNMGEAALVSHMSEKKHKAAAEVAGNVDVECCVGTLLVP